MLNKIKEKIDSSWIFFLITLLLLGVVFFINFDSGIHVWEAFLKLFLGLLPIFGLVFFSIFMFNFLWGPKKIVTFLSQKSGALGYFFAVVFGILSSGPIYMWYPLLSDLQRNGMPDGMAITFLYNRAIKLPFIPMIIHYFGWPFLLVTTFFMVTFSVINGIIGNIILNKKGAS